MSEEDVMEFDDGMLPTLPVGHIRIDSQSEEYGNHIRRIVVVGPVRAGKTSIIDRVCDHAFSESYKPTSGREHRTRIVRLGTNTFKLQLWDHDGVDGYHGLSVEDVMTADGVWVVFDLTDPSALSFAEKCLCTVREGTRDAVPVYLLGNKRDAESARVVDYGSAMSLAMVNNAAYIEVSAKLGTGIEQMTETFTYHLMKEHDAFETASDVEHHTSLHNTVMVSGKPMMRHPSLLEMDAQDELVAPKDGDGRSNWRKLADTVASTTDGGKFIGSSFQDVVKHASIARVAEILSIPAFKRRAEDIKPLKAFFVRRAGTWRAFQTKSLDFFDFLCQRAGVKKVSAGGTIFNEQDVADCMFIVMEGGVNLFSKSPQEDEAHIPIDWSTVKQNLQSAQRSLDAVKLIASVPQASELQSIKKPDDDDGPVPAPSPDPKASVPEGSSTGLAVYDDDESGHKFNARKTWGRLLGGVKLGAVVGHVTDELEKAGRKMHNRGLESSYIGRVDVGDSFGEGGLVRRRPVRHSTAIARYNTTLLVVSVEDYMKLQEAGLMTSAGDEDVQLFSSLPWLRSLGHDSIVRLAAQAKKSTLTAGQIIVQEGEVSTTMYVIKSGEVTVSAFPKAEVDSSSKYPTQRRRVFNLGVIGAGQWFGERPLLTGEKNDFTYTSATPVTLFSINQKLFVQLGKHVTAALIKELTTKLQFRGQRLAELVHASTTASSKAKPLGSLNTTSADNPFQPAPYSVTHKCAGIRLQVNRDILASPKAHEDGTLLLSPGHAPRTVHENSSTRGLSPVRSLHLLSSPSAGNRTLNASPDKATITAGSFPVAHAQDAVSVPFSPQGKAKRSASMTKLDPLPSPPIVASPEPARLPISPQLEGLSATFPPRPVGFAAQVQPLQQFLSPLPTAHTHSFRPSPVKIYSAANTRLTMPEFQSSPASPSYFAEGYVGAGRSPQTRPASSGGASPMRLQPTHAKRAIKSPEAASPSKLKSPAKPRHAVVGDDGEPIFSPYGDLLPTRTLKDTASLVSEYSDRPSASTRDFTRNGDPELLKRMEKAASHKLKRKALKVMGVQ